MAVLKKLLRAAKLLSDININPLLHSNKLAQFIPSKSHPFTQINDQNKRGITI
jgi:hypothetical protein